MAEHEPLDPVPPVPPLPPVPPATQTHSTLPYATSTGYPGAYVGPQPEADQRTWGMIAHLSALVQLLSVPSIAGPLIVWVLKKDTHPFVNDQGKEAINFNLTVLIAALVATPLVCLGIGIIILIAIGIVFIVFTIIAAVKANQGIAYRYPLTLRLIK